MFQCAALHTVKRRSDLRHWKYNYFLIFREKMTLSERYSLMPFTAVKY